jgi:hypothetical protein
MQAKSGADGAATSARRSSTTNQRANGWTKDVRQPEIRAELVDWSIRLDCPRLAVLANMLKRRPSDRYPANSNPSTPELRHHIRQMRSNNPRMSQAAIARAFNVNPGRVSEALKGWRR